MVVLMDLVIAGGHCGEHWSGMGRHVGVLDRNCADVAVMGIPPRRGPRRVDVAVGGQDQSRDHGGNGDKGRQQA
jgi:hypothetical protein